MADGDVWRLIQSVAAFSAVLLSLPAVLKGWFEVRHFRRAQRRAESDFAYELSERLKRPDLARVSEELGYAALVGDVALNHRQRMVLLTFEDAENVIAKYTRVQGLLEVLTEPPYFKWKRRRHGRKSYRLAVVTSCIVFYAVFSFVAVFGPMMFSTRLTEFGIPIGQQITVCFYLVFVAGVALRHGVRLGLAAELQGHMPVSSGGTPRTVGSNGSSDPDDRD